MVAAHQSKTNNVSVLIDLEQGVRRAESLQSLQFLIVNQTRRLIPFDQAVFLSVTDHSVPKVGAISNVAAVDRTAPFVHWVERMAALENKGPDRVIRHSVSQENLSGPNRDDWKTFSPANILWLPLVAPQQGLVGVLWLSRYEPWDEKECVLFDHLALSYAHGLQIFLLPWRFSSAMRRICNRPVRIAAFVLLCLLMLIPVNLTALTPMEVVPKDPFVVASPMNGVVEEILVASNQTVKPEQIVARLDDTQLRNNVAVARKALTVAGVQLEKAGRGAFVNAHDNEVLAELSAQVDLRKAELAFAEERLNTCVLTTKKAGVAVVNRPDEWAGRPVDVGEKILQIADPNQVEIQIMLPVKDAVLLHPGNRVRVFLDSAPLSPREAEVIRSEYEAHLTELGGLAYRVTARFTQQSEPPRIGLRGTAKVFGSRVTLFYYLFRRPLTALRQWMGW